MNDNSSKFSAIKRYAGAGIILGGGAIMGTALLASTYPKNYGVPVSYNGQKYYIRDDSKRVVYPNREACLRDVPPHRHHECEPVRNYHGSSGGFRWYGPVYSPRDGSDYRPSSIYPTEVANSSNVGKTLPGSASAHGFGENGKAFTGSKGG